MDLNHLPLSRKQILSIGQADARINIWEGAVRSGKTVSSLLKWLTYVAAAPRGELVVVAKTQTTAMRNVFAPMQDEDVFGPFARHVKYTSGAPEATILGRRIWVIGANDVRAESRLRGLTAAGAYVDEMTLVPEEFFGQLLNRLSVPGAQLFGTTNPDTPSHWLRRNYLLRADELSLRTWHFTPDDNPALSEDYKASIKAENVGLWFRRRVLGEWCAAEGAVFDMWDEQRHVVDHIPPITQWLCAALDYGTTNPTHVVLLGVGADRCLYAVAEWRYDARQAHRQMTDAEYSERIRGWLDQVPVPASQRPDGTWLRGVSPQYVVVDPSAASLRTQLHRDGVNTVAGNNAVLDGIRVVSSLLAAGRLRVSRNCPALIAEMPGYSWDDKAAEKGEDKPIKVADHGIDALRYAAMTTRSLWQSQIQLTTAA